MQDVGGRLETDDGAEEEVAIVCVAVVEANVVEAAVTGATDGALHSKQPNTKKGVL